MKKNGFTLLEILIIIIIIGIIATIAITSSLGSSKRINQKLYEEKIDYVLTAAKQFGQASTDFFTEECKFLEEPVADSKCFHIKAQTLLDNNFIKVEDIKDPRDVSKNISEVKIEVQYYFDRIHAVVYDDEITTSGFVTINNGAAETNTRSVSLTISSSLSDTTNAEMCVSNTNTCTDWRKYETLIAWELSNEAGEKTVSVWFRDRLKTVHGPVKDSILFVPSSSTGTFVINDGAPYTGSRSVTLKITMNTAETYVTSMCISNTNTCTAWRPFATLVGNWMLTENDGLKTVKVWFRDESGNHFSDLTDTIIYETVKPTGTIAIEAGEYTNKRAVNLILSAVDHESGMDSMCISNTTICDDTKWETYKTSVTGHLLEDLDGDQTVSVWYRDKVGNVSIRYYATTKLDRLPPSEAKVLINNNAPYTKSRDVVLTLSAKDDVSKVASVCVSQSKPCLIFTPFTATYPLTLTGSEGVRTVYAIFRDHAGNDSVQVEDSIILDLTKPVCGNTWTPNPATWKTIPATQEFTLTGSTDAGGSGIASSFKCIAAATNNATCMATVSDNAGNSITCGPSPVNRIDITPPNRTVHNPISQDWTNKNITVTFTSADSESQVSSYKYCITNNGTQCEPTTTGDSVTLTNQGQYTICSLALNHAGLGSIKTCSASNAYKIDKTDPTCGSTWTPNPANWKASGAQTFTLTGSTDSGGSGLTAASFTCTTGTTHGTTCNATIKDKAGNTKTCGPSPINRIDTTIPTTPTFSPTARDWTNGSIVVTFTATDPESGISSYKYCTTTNGTQCEPSTTGSSMTLSATGQHTVCVVAVNNVGRTSTKTCSTANAFKIDKVPPTCVSSGGSTAWRNTNLTITGTCSDTGGSGCVGNSTNVYSTNTNITTGHGGTVKDKAGNSVTCPKNQTVRIDKTPPTCVSSGGSTAWRNTNLTITGTCSDTGGSGCVGNSTNVYSTNTNITTGHGGTVKDNAGNSVTCPKNQTVRIDKTPPTCVSSGGSTAWRNTNLTITGTCSDTGGSGCVGNSTNVYSTNTNITTGHGGTVKDNAGNSVTCPKNQTVRIDKTPPTCVSSGGSTAWRNTNLTITGTCSDTGGSGCVGNSTNVYSTNTNITTGHGGTVKDNAGNSVTCPKNQTVRIDKTPPTCVSSGGSTAWRNTNLTITGTCSDTGGSGCVGNSTNVYSTNTNITTGHGGTVKDNAGNSVTCPKNQTVRIDKTPPTCVSSGGSTAWRNTNLTITGTCSDTGGSGCVGNSTNVYSTNTNITTGHGGTVKDNAGNSVTCPKNQTVRIDKTPPTCVSSGGSTAWRNTNLTITGRCSDTGGSGCVGNSTNVYSSNTNITTGHGGTVKDNAGNSVTCPKNQTVKIDKTPPTCVSSGGSTAWRNTNLTITGKCSDTGGSGCVGNATKTISTNTNSTTQSPGTVKDNAGNSVTCPANQTVKIDKTPPTCTVTKSNTYTTAGVTVKVTGSDSGSGIASGNVTETGIKANKTYTVTDNVGLTGTCKVTISSRTEYRTRSCTQYKSCQNSSCGWNSCLTGSNTCVGGNKSCRTSGCGVELYKSCRTAACGCETYNSCPASVCGVSAYKYCQHSSCGWNPCLTGSNTCVGGYNSCRTSGCGVELYKSCATAGCGVAQYKSCKHSECGYKRCTNTACCGTYCNSYGHIYECYQLTGGYGCGTKCASSTPTSSGQKWYKTTKTCCLSSEPATCTKACCGYATCRTAGCGIESYKTCRHSECGVERYNYCQHSSCGWNSCLTGSNTCVGGYNSCRASGCGVESYKSCPNSSCTCATNKSCRAQACGVERYNYCQNSACGWDPCLTGSNTCVGGYNSCRTSGCGCETWGTPTGWTTTACSSTASTQCESRVVYY